MVDKSRLLKQIVALLDAELARYASSARAAHEEATHEQSRAENKYDTRGLEASYLARGQSKQAAETLEARECYARMAPRSFAAEEPVGIGALVELKGEGERAIYLMGPLAGGREVECDGTEVMVMTPGSPLGALLMGKRAGDQVVLEGRRRQVWTVSAVG